MLWYVVLSCCTGLPCADVMKKIVLDRWLGLATVLALAGGASVAQAAGLRSGNFPGLQAGGDMSAWRLAADDSTQAPEAGQTGASASSSSSGQEIGRAHV